MDENILKEFKTALLEIKNCTECKEEFFYNFVIKHNLTIVQIDKLKSLL